MKKESGGTLNQADSISLSSDLSYSENDEPLAGGAGHSEKFIPVMEVEK